MRDDKLKDCSDSGGERASCVATASAELLIARETAEQLKGLLVKEASTLRRFKGQELMEIIHRKESLARELAEKLQPLKEAKDGRKEDAQPDLHYDSLKACLAEIERLNRSNRVLIEGALAHYRDFVDCLCPASYGPRGAGEQRKDLAAFKGLTFRKEI
jgi:flagellar biosynthesis/type III secretory pathway chaperone